MIAMDIDGTLLNSTGQIPTENLQAIEEAAARGIEMVLVTGRRFDFALPIAEKIPGQPHLIVNNGALAKSLDGSAHLRSLLPRENALQILKATEEFREFAGVVFDRAEGHRVILETVNWDDPFRGGYLRRNREHIGLCAPLTDCLNGTNPPEDPIQVVFSGNCQPMRAVMQKLEPLATKYGFAQSLTEYLERNIPRQNIMAVGDNWNDSEMLEFAGTPVVMGNSVAGLKTRGWPVTGTNDQAGLADAIRTYALHGAAEAV